MNHVSNARLDRRLVLAGGVALAAGVFLAPRLALAAEPAEVVEGADGAHKIEIDKMAFGTPELKVKVGDTVTWTNKDGMAHNVHFRQGPMKGKPAAQGKMLNTGDTYTLKFNEAGEYAYICTPHPMMKAKIVVEA